MGIKVNGIEPASLVNGEGIRYTIFFQGCPHKCPGCHSPHTWDLNSYNLYLEPADIIRDIKKYTKYLAGITITGGDPLMQIQDLYDLLKEIRHDPELKDINIWLWTGYTFEEIPFAIKRYLDVIVDGPYIQGLRPLKWRGSSNQKLYRRDRRIINGNKWIEETENGIL